MKARNTVEERLSAPGVSGSRRAGAADSLQGPRRGAGVPFGGGRLELLAVTPWRLLQVSEVYPLQGRLRDVDLEPFPGGWWMEGPAIQRVSRGMK